MGSLADSLLERYGRWLRLLDNEASRTEDGEYLDLLGPGEVDELLFMWDEISRIDLSPEQRAELTKLDDILMKHYRVVAEWMPTRLPGESRSHWWWYLDEGPQVREEAEKAA